MPNKLRNIRSILYVNCTTSAQPDCSEALRLGTFPNLGACMSSGLGTRKKWSISTALDEKELLFFHYVNYSDQYGFDKL